jgi:DNA-binding response OmpR family regulator
MAGASPSVLVVEDNWQIASAIRKWLEAEAMEVVGPAPTVARAEALMSEELPDVAIVDLNLRGEFSYALIEALEEKQVKVIVVTGYAANSRRLREGALVLEKPVTRDALVRAIRNGDARRRPI